MIVISMLAVLAASQGAAAACRQPDAVILALPLHDFDQGDAGWRSLDKEGCEAVVADAIARYRELNREALEGEYINNLIWHEGQLRASAGQTDRAIELMLATHAETTESFAAYADATVAFLRHDREALLAARDRLAALPQPDYYRQAVDRFRTTYPDKPVPTWPPNLSFVDGFIACFERPYSEAYGCDAGGNVH